MEYVSLKAAVAEAGTQFVGRKVRETGQISPFEVALRFDRKAALVLSINPLRPGLFILNLEIPSNVIGSPFSDLLNARIRGTTLISLRMPESGERLVFLELEAGWPARSGDSLRVVLEVMGRHSNLAVLQDGKILQPLKIVPSQKSRLRPILPGEPWKPPPLRPGTGLEEILREDLPSPSSPEAARELLRIVRGLSPYSARQAVMRASEGGREALQRALAAMAFSANGEKGYLHRAGNKIHLLPFEPLLTSCEETFETFIPFSAASAVWRKGGAFVQTTERDETQQLASGLRQLEKKLLSALAILDRELERCQTHGNLRVMAETLLIHVSEVRQGQDSVTFPNPYEPEKEMTIPLDPSLSVRENADLMFGDARRLKRGVEEVAVRRKKIDEELSVVRCALEEIMERGDSTQAIKLLGKEFGGRSKKAPQAFRAYGGPGRKHTVEGFTILVGRSAIDNERVTFQAANPHDLWLHARDYAGSHVVILTEKRKVPDNVLFHAAALAAEGSGARNEVAPEIMVTERKWVKKLKGGKPGKVTVERFRTVRPRRK